MLIFASVTTSHLDMKLNLCGHCDNGSCLRIRIERLTKTISFKTIETNAGVLPIHICEEEIINYYHNATCETKVSII